MAEKTTNYEMFKKHEHNRMISEGNVLRIMNSIKARNLLEFRPIDVDANMRVIDGQHRLEAAKRLQIPIFYEIKKSLKKEDIVLLNDNSKNWTREDYLNYYVQEGNEEYIKFKRFIERNNLSVAMGLVILGLASAKKERHEPAPFKAGKLKFPDAAHEIDAMKILDQSREVVDYISPKLEGNHQYIHGPVFRRALYIFLSIGAVEFTTFMEKLAYRIDLIRPCSRLVGFVNIFKMIYNFRNRYPITLDEFEAV